MSNNTASTISSNNSIGALESSSIPEGTIPSTVTPSGPTEGSTLLQSMEGAEVWKQKGNDLFQKGEWEKAIEAYTRGIEICRRDSRHNLDHSLPHTSKSFLLLLSLLSNRAMCYLKVNRYDDCCNDCSTALLDLQNYKQQPSQPEHETNIPVDDKSHEQLRSKLLFRRAKAKFLSCSAAKSASLIQPTLSQQQQQSFLNEAAKDLLLLLQMDPNNREGNDLLKAVRGYHLSSTKAANNTPIGKTITAIADFIDHGTSSHNANKDKDTSTATCVHHIKVLLGLLDNDLSNGSMELGRIGGVSVLLSVASAMCSSDKIGNSSDQDEINRSKAAVLAIRCIAVSGTYPLFVRTFLLHHQSDLHNLMQLVSATAENAATATNDISMYTDVIVSVLSCWVRLVLHADRDDLNPEVSVTNATNLKYDAILGSIKCALKLCVFSTTNISSISTDALIRAVLDLVGTWTCGVERDANIRAALAASSIGPNKDPTIPPLKSPMEIHQMTPQQLATYRKRQHETKLRDTNWGIERCTMLFDSGVYQMLVSASCASYDPIVRREATITVGKVLAAFNDDEIVKTRAEPFLQDTTKVRPPMIEEIVEEVYNEDGDVKEADEEKEEITSTSCEDLLLKKMERAMVACSILLTTNKDVGSWGLSTGWDTSGDDLNDLIQSEDIRALSLASEVVSAAATVESCRPIISALVSGGNMEQLLYHPNRDIRSGAASAVAKLGLAQQQQQQKSRDDSDAEYISLLAGACDLLLDDNDDDENNTKIDKNNSNIKTNKGNSVHSGTSGINHFRSFATSSVERGVEMMTYLMSNTNIKEEICDGFTPPNRSSNGENKVTALDLLVRTATETPGIGESLTGFGLASIFRNMAATNEELRALMFADKDVTMEQYDEMQKLQKTEEEKELLMDPNEKDPDTVELRNKRICKMASSNVPRALVALLGATTDNSSNNNSGSSASNCSEHTLEQITYCMNQMANEPSVRGSLIQQGVLSACIKMETKEGPVETETMKTVLRLCRHTIAKLLITTNPNLLTSAQRLGSVKPLLRLVRDNHRLTKDLQHFEALLALTNIGSTGDDARNRIVTEKGIPAMHFAMFSDHPMVRRAATEAMCNLVGHDAMTQHLLEQVDHLRLWLAFAEDYEDDDDDIGGKNCKYECSRAAAGCLAMATQNNVQICRALVELPKFQPQMMSMMESGRLELMHRTFCIVLNLVQISEEDDIKNDTDSNNNSTLSSPRSKTKIRDKVKEAGLVTFCRAYIENYIRNGVDGLEFLPHEKPLLPVVLELAKNIVKIAG